jgi:hypothetical protein
MRKIQFCCVDLGVRLLRKMSAIIYNQPVLKMFRMIININAMAVEEDPTE